MQLLANSLNFLLLHLCYRSVLSDDAAARMS
jgi:hypothetical protein